MPRGGAGYNPKYALRILVAGEELGLGAGLPTDAAGFEDT